MERLRAIPLSSCTGGVHSPVVAKAILALTPDPMKMYTVVARKPGFVSDLARVIGTY